MCRKETPQCLLFYCCENCSHSFYDLEGNIRCGVVPHGRPRCNDKTCEHRDCERIHVSVTGGI